MSTELMLSVNELIHAPKTYPCISKQRGGEAVLGIVYEGQGKTREYAP